MKVDITESGTLTIDPETALETFALGKWGEGVDWNAAVEAGVSMVINGRGCMSARKVRTAGYAEKRLDELAAIMRPAIDRIRANPHRYSYDEGVDVMAVIAHEFLKSDGLPAWRDGELWRHKKTGGIYRVLCWSTAENDGTTPLTTYQNVDTHQTWTRPKAEFEDGRFERVAKAERA